jgi:DNA-directed RNA polymerase subunit RPC12/RpoP
MPKKDKKDVSYTCFTCGKKYGKGGGLRCSYHDWTEGVFCSKCFKPRYLMGTDEAREEASTEIHCNKCLAKRKKAAAMYEEMFLS